MKIVNVIQRYPPAVGGSETWCQEVCRYLARKGHEVRVLTLDVNKEEEFWRDPHEDEWTVAFGSLSFDDKVLVRRYRRSLPIPFVHHQIYKRVMDQWMKVYFYGPHSSEMYGKMWREIQWADVVFLHTQPYPHNYIAFALAKFFKKKTIIVPHFHPTHPSYERRSNYWLLRQCDVVVTVTEFEKQYLAAKKIPADKLYVTGNAIHPRDYLPVDLAEFRHRLEQDYGLRPDDQVITFIGRKMEEKGVGHLVAAVRDLLREMPLKLFLVGPSFDWFTDLYAHLSPAERTRIIDAGVLSHQDKVNLLHLSNLLALPSRYEAFGIVFLEAWICGVPVLGANNGAVPSVIGDEGFLATFGDVEDLKAKLRTAFKDPQALRKMGARGRAKVLEHYTWDAIGMKAEHAVTAALHGQNATKKKVVVATNAYPPRSIGGAELLAHEYARVLQKQGHEVVVFAGELNNAGERHSIRQDLFEGIPVYRVCLHSRDYSYDFFNFFHRKVHDRFDKFLEEFAPDVVHCHNLIGLSASLLQVSKRRGLKTVLTLHDYWGFCLKNTQIKRPELICDDHTRCHECKATISGHEWSDVPVRMRSDFVAMQLQAVDTFISPSAYLGEAYIRAGIPREKLRVIANGVDVERFAKIKRAGDLTRLRFSFLGYLGRHKGIHTIFEALELLGPEREQVVINIIGEGELRGYLEERVHDLGYTDAVRFWGHVDNSRIADVYRETDVLILPSVWPENLPVSIGEAMTARIPVIASRMGGIPELVEDGKTGYLFQAGDPADLARKITEFLLDRSKLAVFGENAFRKIAPDTFDNQVNQVIAIYNEPLRLATHPAMDEDLIVCLGKQVDTVCAMALEMLAAQAGRQRIVMLDWLDEDQIRNAKAVWIVDKAVGVDDVAVALRNQIPLVVPADSFLLKELCFSGKCGLYYQDAFDAVECLIYLCENEETRIALGQNAFRLFYSNKTVDV